MRALRAAIAVLFGIVITAGSFAPYGLAVADARDAAAKNAPPAVIAPLRDEAPHLSLKAKPAHVRPDEELTVSGELRGYELGGSDFCLQPDWNVYGTNKDGGLHRLDVKPPDPAQCRDHEFVHVFKFANPGVYGIRLVLRTTGSKVRVAEWGVVYIEVTE